MSTPVEMREWTPDERKAALARAVANEVRNGWHVESQTDYQAVLRKGQRTSHGLHIFLSFITLGLWLIVWGAMVLVNRSRHLVIDVDAYGNVNISR